MGEGVGSVREGVGSFREGVGLMGEGIGSVRWCWLSERGSAQRERVLVNQVS